MIPFRSPHLNRSVGQIIADAEGYSHQGIFAYDGMRATRIPAMLVLAAHRSAGHLSGTRQMGGSVAQTRDRYNAVVLRINLDAGMPARPALRPVEGSRACCAFAVAAVGEPAADVTATANVLQQPLP